MTDITRILRDIAAGRKNELNDYWSKTWCADAADYIDQLRGDLYVCHMDTEILKIGTQDECQAHKDAQTFHTDCWKINKLADYGSFCYDEGWESAAAQGAYYGPEY